LWTGPGRRGTQPGPIGRQYVFADGDGSGSSGGSGGQTSASQQIFKKVDSVANLKKPSAATINRLSAAIASVMKEDKDYETKKKDKDDALADKKEKVLKDIVKEYGVGLTYVNALTFSNFGNPDDIGETRGTSTTVFDSCLTYPGFCASVVLHESSHAQRNAELEAAGIDLNKLSEFKTAKWKALIEVEAYQLEMDYAATTGLTAKDKAFVKKKRDDWLAEIDTLWFGANYSQDILNGKLDQVRDKFFKTLQSQQQTSGGSGSGGSRP
jgi:hypothetical protein